MHYPRNRNMEYIRHEDESFKYPVKMTRNEHDVIMPTMHEISYMHHQEPRQYAGHGIQVFRE